MNFTNGQFKYLETAPLLTYVIAILFAFGTGEVQGQNQVRNTAVSIRGDQFYINNVPTYVGRTWITSDGTEYPIEGLLMNARLIQGVFDDLNPDTQGQWSYPDTRQWDPDRNTGEFVDAMASWREHGLLGFTVNLQGGCPYGYCNGQPWDNSAFSGDGSLRVGFMNRLEQIFDRADELGMVVILGYFYFGQDENLEDEEAVKLAVDNATEWVLEKGYRNVIVEINNECNVRYDHAILRCDRVHELIERTSAIERDGRSLSVSTSLGGGSVPPENIVEASDYVLLHGNGVQKPERIVEMIQEVRGLDAYALMPIVYNEDDQPWRVNEQGWGEKGNNFAASIKNYASWGFFDFRLEQEHEDFNLGFQSVPVNWHITSDRKRDFFNLMAEITGSPGTPEISLEWSREVGELKVQIENKRTGAPIEYVELLVNNEVVAAAQEEPYEFHIDEMPDGEHFVRARAVYVASGREVSIESPTHRNPWWPYGGPSH